MITTRPHRRQGHGLWGGVASLLVILLLVPGVWPWAGATPPEDIPVQGRTPRLQVGSTRGGCPYTCGRRISGRCWPRFTSRLASPSA
jgi:hypothetical protein